jgi:hypothetical protein
MMTDMYVFDLETGLPVKAESMEEYNAFIEVNRLLDQTELATCWISTVFLGLDHRLSDSGPPLVFETMVFPSRRNLSEIDADRYTTREEALAGHKRFVEQHTSELEVLSKAYAKPKKEAR